MIGPPLARTCQLPSRSRLRQLRLCQEIRHPHCIEIEHLGARQFSIAEAIEPENLFIYALSIATAPTLVPQDYNIIAARGNDLRIHLSLRLSRLQRMPSCAPAARLWLDATKGSSIR